MCIVCHPYPNEKGDTQMLIEFIIGIVIVMGIFYALLLIDSNNEF
jgi:hypothetical protein